ncbi:MAG: hypothetical protein U5R31_04405 [Acidimicrobiia bacterium]|nr:hypothetical protein [Acidimicrobiia bacterium]
MADGRPRRRGGHAPAPRRGPEHRWLHVVPRGAQALRARERRSPLVPLGRLDARPRHPRRHHRSRSGARRPRPRRGRRGRARLPGQGQPPPARAPPGHVPPARGVAGVHNHVDPGRRFQTDLAARLGL